MPKFVERIKKSPKLCNMNIMTPSNMKEFKHTDENQERRRKNVDVCLRPRFFFLRECGMRFLCPCEELNAISPPWGMRVVKS